MAAGVAGIARWAAWAGPHVTRNEPNRTIGVARKLAMILRIWGRWIRAARRARLPGKDLPGPQADAVGLLRSF
jgi:hypothetical protein